jgi:putative DNA primase/helicase
MFSIETRMEENMTKKQKCPDLGTPIEAHHENDHYVGRGTSHKLAELYLKETAIHGEPTCWYWRGEWYTWAESRYQAVSHESVARAVLEFLKGEAPIKINTIRGIVDLLRMMQFCDVDQAPSWLIGKNGPDPTHLFSVANGMLYLPDHGNLELLPHTPSFWGISSTKYPFTPTSSCHRWMRFLRQLWGRDPEVTEMLQEWFGYCLLQNTTQQKILAIIGPPRSGKSTIARVLTDLLGRDNVASPSIRSLSGSFGLWGLLDKSLAIIPDATLPKPCPALEELLKSISGEDSMDVHRKGMAPLTGIRFPTRLMLLANELPAFQDRSRALERRLIVLKTENSFLGKEDVGLTSKLLKELPGILNWAIVGLQRLRIRGHFLETTSAIDLDNLRNTLPDKERISRIVVTYERPDRIRSNRPYVAR